MQIRRFSSNQETSSPREEIRFLYRPASQPERERERERIIRRVSFGIIHYDPLPLPRLVRGTFHPLPPSSIVVVPLLPISRRSLFNFIRKPALPFWNLHRGRLVRRGKNWIVKNSLKKIAETFAASPFFIYLFPFPFRFLRQESNEFLGEIPQRG